VLALARLSATGLLGFAWRRHQAPEITDDEYGVMWATRCTARSTCERRRISVSVVPSSRVSSFRIVPSSRMSSFRIVPSSRMSSFRIVPSPRVSSFRIVPSSRMSSFRLRGGRQRHRACVARARSVLGARARCSTGKIVSQVRERGRRSPDPLRRLSRMGDARRSRARRSRYMKNVLNCEVRMHRRRKRRAGTLHEMVL
jgi:hypothetical protein